MSEMPGDGFPWGQSLWEAVSRGPRGLVLTGGEGEILWINAAYEAMCGYGLDELRGCNPRILKSGHQGADFYEEMWRSLRQRGYWEGSLLNRGRHGRLYWEDACILRLESPEGIRYGKWSRDVTSAHQEQEALRVEQSAFEGFFEHSSEAIFQMSEGGGMSRLNPSARKMMGLEEGEDERWNLFTHFFDSLEDVVRLRKALEDQPAISGFQTRLRRKDGLLRTVEMSLFPVGHVYWGKQFVVIRDITDQAEHESDILRLNAELLSAQTGLQDAQTSLIRQEKLASIGQLAAGVAHEINNPVGFVSSNFSTLQKYALHLTEGLRAQDLFLEKRLLGHDPQAAQAWKDLWREHRLDMIMDDLPMLLEETREGLERITHIVQNLRDFSRVDAGQKPGPYHLNRGLESALLVARNEIKYVAEVETEWGDVPGIMAYGGEINQVLLNLLVNAAQAIKEAGLPEGAGRIRVKTEQSRGGIVCQISDNGCGIAAGDLERIFQPFFTTKPTGQGTGLGLSISREVVEKRHGGRLTATSRTGEGSTFTLWLPLSPADSVRGGEIPAESDRDG